MQERQRSAYTKTLHEELQRLAEHWVSCAPGGVDQAHARLQAEVPKLAACILDGSFDAKAHVPEVETDL